MLTNFYNSVTKRFQRKLSMCSNKDTRKPEIYWCGSWIFLFLLWNCISCDTELRMLWLSESLFRHDCKCFNVCFNGTHNVSVFHDENTTDVAVVSGFILLSEARSMKSYGRKKRGQCCSTVVW